MRSTVLTGPLGVGSSPQAADCSALNLSEKWLTTAVVHQFEPTADVVHQFETTAIVGSWLRQGTQHCQRLGFAWSANQIEAD